MVFKGYHNKQEETLVMFTKDGWLKSGDIGEFSKEGFLRITDRKKDIIVTSGGKKIAPQAIEALLEKSEYVNFAVVLGEKRRFVSAFLSLNQEAVRKFADSRHIKYSSWDDLREGLEIRTLASQIVESVNKQLSRFESIKKFVILPHDFSIETGELTPTMKVKRRMVEEKYRDKLDELYK